MWYISRNGVWHTLVWNVILMRNPTHQCSQSKSDLCITSVILTEHPPTQAMALLYLQHSRRHTHLPVSSHFHINCLCISFVPAVCVCVLHSRAPLPARILSLVVHLLYLETKRLALAQFFTYGNSFTHPHPLNPLPCQWRPPYLQEYKMGWDTCVWERKSKILVFF